MKRTILPVLLPLLLLVCPIGMLANFSAIGVFPFLLIGTLVAVGAVFGSLVCGWACPFGFLQDLIARVPTPKFELPAWMGLTRYAVLLVFVLAVPFLYGEVQCNALSLGSVFERPDDHEVPYPSVIARIIHEGL